MDRWLKLKTMKRMQYGVVATMIGVLLWPQVGYVQPQKPCLKLKSIATSHDVLRQGGSLFTVILKLEAQPCALPGIAGHPPAQDITLDVHPESGIETLPVYKYLGTVHAPSLASRIEHSRRMGSRDLWLALTVAAAPDLPVGRHTLAAVVSYTALDRQGNLSFEKLPVIIPIQVVPASSRVKQLIRQRFLGVRLWRRFTVLNQPHEMPASRLQSTENYINMLGWEMVRGVCSGSCPNSIKRTPFPSSAPSKTSRTSRRFSSPWVSRRLMETRLSMRGHRVPAATGARYANKRLPGSTTASMETWCAVVARTGCGAHCQSNDEEDFQPSIRQSTHLIPERPRMVQFFPELQTDWRKSRCRLPRVLPIPIAVPFMEEGRRSPLANPR